MGIFNNIIAIYQRYCFSAAVSSELSFSTSCAPSDGDFFAIPIFLSLGADT